MIKFSYIIEKYDLDSVGIEDIKKILREISIDMVSGNNSVTTFPKDAITYLYSGHRVKRASVL